VGLRVVRAARDGNPADVAGLTSAPSTTTVSQEPTGWRPGPRHVRLVLVRDDERAPLGALPAFEVAVPWWQEAAPVVDGALGRFGVAVTILRLLEASPTTTHGGAVTYLAEIGPGVEVTTLPLEPWHSPLADDPRRLPWARPGGPAADLAWAEGVLAARGLARLGPPRQMRTWNLSSLWTMPLADGSAAWLKVVPPFFAHEGDALERLAGGPVPALLGHHGPRVLMPELRGEDQYDAGRPVLDRMIEVLVDLQHREAPNVDALLAIGLPDWRGPALTDALRALVGRHGPTLEAPDRDALVAFVGGLPERFAAIAACGLPDTLVHGDFHPGNVRADGERLTLLDWGDCGVGQPLLDEPAFLQVRPAIEEELRAIWHDRWRARVPGSDPARASRLLGPVGAARQALIYETFLDGIEASEQPYHQLDLPRWLRRTASMVRDEARLRA
jgi:hypothetical protein